MHVFMNIRFNVGFLEYILKNKKKFAHRHNNNGNSNPEKNIQK